MKTTVLVLSLIANVAAAVFFLPHLRDQIGGHRYNLSAHDDVSRLRRLIYQSVPLQEAVENYRNEHGSYPPDNLAGVELPANYKSELIDGVGGIHYERKSSGYDLFIKLTWDASLRFSSDEKTWTYDPGNGGAASEVRP